MRLVDELLEDYDGSYSTDGHGDVDDGSWHFGDGWQG
jgi:hypothetical protein